MATRTAKLRVEVDGEKKYKQAISELNKGNAVLASEMKKLSAEYAGNEKSVEALTAKGDLLQRQLLQQKDKVATLRQAVADATNKYGEADKRTQNWVIQLNNAEAEQAKLEHAIDNTNKELTSQGEEMTSLGDTVQSITDKLGIRLPEGAKKALDSMKGFSAGTVAAMGAAAAAVAALIKACRELHEITLKAASDADQLITESLVSGVSTQTLQQWTYAQEQIDVSVSTMTGALTKLTKAAYEAQNGNDKLSASFADLGVSITDESGQLRDAESIFYDVIDALGEVGNQTERDALTMGLLGKSAQDLNPLIVQGSKALKDLGKQAEETGYVLDESQLKKLAEVDDAYQKMQLTIEAAKKELAIEFAPASKTAMETFGNAVKTASDALERSKLVNNLASLVTSTASIIDAGTTLISMLPSWLNPINSVSNAFRGLAVVMATIADTANVISGLFTLDFNRVKTGLGLNLRSGQMSNLQQLKYSSGDYVSYNASGNDNWRGGLTWVGESGPELVGLPSGSKVYSSQESRQIGSTTYNITVANIQQLDEIVDWYESRRIKGRMA